MFKKYVPAAISTPGREATVVVEGNGAPVVIHRKVVNAFKYISGFFVLCASECVHAFCFCFDEATNRNILRCVLHSLEAKIARLEQENFMLKSLITKATQSEGMDAPPECAYCLWCA